MTSKERIENAIRHIQTATDIDPWAMEIAVDAMQRMMNADGDLISRREGIDHFRLIVDATNKGCEYDEGFIDGLEFCISHMSTMPSAQPERKTGYWLVKQDQNGSTYGECSRCHSIQYAGHMPYCPYCGLKMEETL